MRSEIRLDSVWRRFLLGIWIAGATAACGDARSPATDTIVWDSSGVTIVDNVLEGDGPVARWETPRVGVLVGALDGGTEQELYRVRGISRLQDRSVAVLNGTPPEVRVFDQEGRFLWKAGGSGSGPGEFVSPSGLQRWKGDSLVVYDPPIRRFTVLSLDGDLGRTFTPAGQVFTFLGFVSGQQAISSQGTLRLVAGQTPDGLQEQNPRILEQVHVVTGDRDTIAVVQGEEMFFSVTSGEGGIDHVSHLRVPFTVPPAIAVSGGRTYVLHPHRGAVETYDAEGRLLRVIRTSEVPRPVEQSDRERFVSEVVEKLSNPDRVGEIREAHEQMSLPDVMPRYDRVLADEEGMVWVRRYNPFSSDHSAWIIFGPDGRVMGEIDLPSDIDVFHVGPGLVTGVRSDNLGVEYVVQLEVDLVVR